jgi:hypothetical protein
LAAGSPVADLQQLRDVRVDAGRKRPAAEELRPGRTEVSRDQQEVRALIGEGEERDCDGGSGLQGLCCYGQ